MRLITWGFRVLYIEGTGNIITTPLNMGQLTSEQETCQFHSFPKRSIKYFAGVPKYKIYYYELNKQRTLVEFNRDRKFC